MLIICTVTLSPDSTFQKRARTLPIAHDDKAEEVRTTAALAVKHQRIGRYRLSS